MSPSIAEEILSALYALCALIAFQNSWVWCGGLFTILAVLATIGALVKAWKEAVEHAAGDSDSW